MKKDCMGRLNTFFSNKAEQQTSQTQQLHSGERSLDFYTSPDTHLTSKYSLSLYMMELCQAFSYFGTRTADIVSTFTVRCENKYIRGEEEYL